MKLRSCTLRMGCFCVAGLLLSTAQAAPWSKISTKKGAEPVAKKSAYALADTNGPWMILAASFSGDGADRQANDLVEELRTRFKLPAYVYQKEFDFSKPLAGRGVDRFGDPQSMKYRRSDDILEIAVMVGDYPNVTDPKAQSVLKKLKYLKPNALDATKRGTSAQTLGALRSIQQAIQPAGSAEKEKGPMRNAFLTTNPLLPADYYAPKGVDKLVLEMNKGVKWTLLDCPGRYTVKVATFSGQVVLDQKIIQKIEHGSEIKSRLAEAADKAHSLTAALRAKGVEAYEFHDRYQSIVTVGNFASVGNKMPNGKIDLDPALYAIMQKYGADKKTVPGQAAPQLGQPKTEGKIPFDVQPMPVEVPRRSISADYARNARD